mmetsp:Transcript_41261/g.95534  ORF Transcript_41261/g.95534 Transcript_41261/m.95534 type:complete len:356 (+) Transcript_41261:85-1152(+)
MFQRQRTAGAYSSAAEGAPPRPSGNLAARFKSPCFVFTSLGVTILMMLLLVPVWNSIKMLHNPVFLRFVGKDIPVSLIAACVCLVALFMFVSLIFFRCSPKEALSEQNVLMMANIFITLVGALIMIISLPLRRSGVKSFTEIEQTCAQAHGLGREYNGLLDLRQQPSCIRLPSIEQCDGFNQTVNTDLLKAMEFKYKCSGWCSPPKLTMPTEPRRQYSVGLLQLDGAVEESRPSSKASRLWAFRDLRMKQPHMFTELPNSIYEYPPTLFSTLNFQSTCHYMAARDTHYFLLDTSDELYYEGVLLMVISISIGFLKLLGFCVKDNIFSKVRKNSYGATPHYVSQISQGVLSRAGSS